MAYDGAAGGSDNEFRVDGIIIIMMMVMGSGLTNSTDCHHSDAFKPFSGPFAEAALCRHAFRLSAPFVRRGGEGKHGRVCCGTNNDAWANISVPSSVVFAMFYQVTVSRGPTLSPFAPPPLPRMNPVHGSAGLLHAAHVGSRQLLQKQGVVVHPVGREGLHGRCRSMKTYAAGRQVRVRCG